MPYNKCFRYLRGAVSKPRTSIYRHTVKDLLKKHVITEDISTNDDIININHDVSLSYLLILI